MEEESAKFTDLSLQVALGVHRPLFKDCPSGLGIQGKCQVCQSLCIDHHFAGGKFTDLPLQISPYKEVSKKNQTLHNIEQIIFLKG